MKVNMKQPILDYEGHPIKDPDPEGRVQTFRDYAIQALNSQAQDEPVLTAEHKNKVYMLSTKLFTVNEVKLTLDDRGFIKERVGKVYPALVYGRMCDILEGEPLPDENVPTEQPEQPQPETKKK